MKKIYIFPLLLLLALQVQAQQFPYFFSVRTEMYSDLTNDVPVIAPFEDPTEPWDDPFFKAPLEFDFTFLDNTTDTLYNPNGVGAFFVFEMPDTYGYAIGYDYFLAYANDLIDRGDLSGTPASPITYVTEGNPGDRIFKLQYKNAGFFGERFGVGSTDDFINFQVWLFEGSNDIEIHFGPSDFPNPLDSLDDYSGPLVGIIDSLFYYGFNAAWILADDPANPTVWSLTYSEVDTLYYTMDGHPANGTVYRFGTSPNVGVEDLDHADVFKLYPTLVQDRIQIEISEPDWIGKQAVMQIIDNQGRLLTRYQTSLEARMEMELQRLPAGIYYFTLMAEDIHLNRKFIKQ